MESIIRKPTKEELDDFIPVTKSGNQSNPREEFLAELHKQASTTRKDGGPFCEIAAKDDWESHFSVQAKQHVRKFGKVMPEKITPIKMDWSKYSDLKNFILVEEGERYDEYLSKRHNIQAFLKFRVYSFKGYEAYKETVYEPALGAWDKDGKKEKA